MRGNTQGFVLVNALVLVAALASVAVFLLARAERGRAVIEMGTAADQLTLNLDAFDALAMAVLARDLNNIDHAGERWAQPLAPVDLARGKVAGELEDLQGRFNINWLISPSFPLSHLAFSVLLERKNLSPEIGRDIRDFLQSGGPLNKTPFTQQDPGIDPVGGAIFDVEQLRRIPSLSGPAFERLRPVITALPGDSTLNVNTAGLDILSAFLPDLAPAALARLITQRDREPFTSTKGFLIAAGVQDATDDDEGDGDEAQDPMQLNKTTISVTSDWFRARARAEVGTLTASRQTLIQRRGRPPRFRTAWRLTTRP